MRCGLKCGNRLSQATSCFWVIKWNRKGKCKSKDKDTNLMDRCGQLDPSVRTLLWFLSWWGQTKKHFLPCLTRKTKRDLFCRDYLWLHAALPDSCVWVHYVKQLFILQPFWRLSGVDSLAAWGRPEYVIWFEQICKCSPYTKPTGQRCDARDNRISRHIKSNHREESWVQFLVPSWLS